MEQGHDIAETAGASMLDILAQGGGCVRGLGETGSHLCSGTLP
jgi:hypothetical protein